AARDLSSGGIEATVIDARSVKPLDEELIIAAVTETGALVTVEENVKAGGFGSAVLELLESRGLGSIRMVRLGIPDLFVTHGERRSLLEGLGLTAAGIAEAARSVAGALPGKSLGRGRPG
ncbi:MAG: 1-deoxy-D-xylulose-5-phosphate synthase, partial [Firmicutes bacterium]|nr:1-deoxy-D-xylulose-5-phosphate synthase [Bacillota bacterium]